MLSVHADVMFEPGTTRSKGCGIVSFANAGAAANAIRTLHDTDLKGRLIFVREDREAGGGGAAGTGKGGGGKGGGGGATSVYVGNLSWDVTWQDLKDHFKQAGAVGAPDWNSLREQPIPSVDSRPVRRVHSPRRRHV